MLFLTAAFAHLALCAKSLTKDSIKTGDTLIPVPRSEATFPPLRYHLNTLEFWNLLTGNKLLSRPLHSVGTGAYTHHCRLQW